MSFDDLLPLVFIAIFVANALRRRGGRAVPPPTRPPSRQPGRVPPLSPSGPDRAELDADGRGQEPRARPVVAEEATSRTIDGPRDARGAPRGDRPLLGGFDLERALEEARRRVAEANASGGGATGSNPPSVPGSTRDASRPFGPAPATATVTPRPPLASPPRDVGAPQVTGFLGREGAAPAPPMARATASQRGSASTRPPGRGRFDGVKNGPTTDALRGGPQVTRRWTWDAEAAVRGTVWNVALSEPASIGWARRWGASRRP